ncbi:MAG: hypothetical protein RLZZ301_748 [Bacteroidota bacterium]|jgi:NADH-quinone oxidoreductase subunit N
MDSIVILFITGLIGLFVGMAKKPLLSLGLSLAGLGTAALAAYYKGAYTSPLSNYANSIGTSASVIILLCAFVAFSLIAGFTLYRKETEHTSDYIALILFSLCGAIMICDPKDLFIFFLGLEILSIPIYVLVAIEKGSSLASEAAVKYFFMGSFATALLLFGVALVYGATGTFVLAEMKANLTMGIWQNPMAIVGSLFMLAGFVFKIGAVPFHFWGPDVYQGSSNAVLMYMASIVKIAGTLAFVSVFASVFESSYFFWSDLISAILVISLFYGYITASKQVSFKRLVAYSSIANAGILLLTILSQVHYQLELFLMAYGAATIALVTINQLVNDEEDKISAWEGIAWKHPILGVALVVALLSLAGIPPTAGFFGKFFLLTYALPEAPITVILALIASVIGAFIYLRILLLAIKKPAHIEKMKLPIGQLVVLLSTIFIGLVWFFVS